MIAAFCKTFNLTPDYVLTEISYANIVLYSSAIPGHDDEKEDEIIRADDPKNKDKVNKILYG